MRGSEAMSNPNRRLLSAGALGWLATSLSAAGWALATGLVVFGAGFSGKCPNGSSCGTHLRITLSVFLVISVATVAALTAAVVARIAKRLGGGKWFWRWAGGTLAVSVAACEVLPVAASPSGQWQTGVKMGVVLSACAVIVWAVVVGRLLASKHRG